MNRHFEDTQYYVKRAGETAKKGVAAEREAVEQRVRALTGRAAEPEPTRAERARTALADRQTRAKHGAKRLLRGGRRKVRAVQER